jgi:cytidylate kinase
VLRVFLWAPEADRRRTLMARFDIDEPAARRKMHETDSNRAAYMHQVFGRDWLDPRQYDLVINTARIGYQAAAEVILRCAQVAQPATTAG